MSNSQPDEIDLSGDVSRLRIMEENKHYVINDKETGRIDDVSIAPRKERGTRRVVTIESTCTNS